MDVMMMPIDTQGVACTACIAWHFMNQPAFQKGFQGTVNRYAVVFTIGHGLNVCLRNSRILFHKYGNDINPALGDSEGVIF